MPVASFFFVNIFLQKSLFLRYIMELNLNENFIFETEQIKSHQKFKLTIQKQRPNQEINNRAPGTILSRFANEYSRVLVVIISFQTQWRIILIEDAEMNVIYNSCPL